MISIYRLTKNYIYDGHSDKAWYSFGRQILSNYIRPSVKQMQKLVSLVFSKFGINLVWEMFAAVSDFHENRFLVLRGHNGITLIGKIFYISRKNFRYRYRDNEKFQESISAIVDATGQNLIPITFIENTLASEGTFKIRKRFMFRNTFRTHIIDRGSPRILLPEGYSHFGHFVPQLLPFIIRESSRSFAVNLPVPDDINRNIEIFQYFDISPNIETTQFPRFKITCIASQNGLYPADSDLILIRDLHLQKFSHRNFKYANNRHRLYLSRENASLGRKVLNESELLTEISELGFLVVDPSTLSYAEASELFANSEIVAGPGGSAFFHLFAMKKGSVAIDFSGDKFIRWHLRKMSLALGIQHTMIINKCDTDLNITLNVPIVVQILKDAINLLEQ